MGKTELNIKKITLVKELHAFIGLLSPLSPLIRIIDQSKKVNLPSVEPQKLLLGLNNISIKKSFKGKLKYGKNHYDFDDWTKAFIAPNQIFVVEDEEDRNNESWSLLFHPELINCYPLGKAIKNFSFFSYTVNEALHLSNEEENIIEVTIQNSHEEINSRLDNLSQDVIVSNLELLLSYCNCFYSRQSITRKMASNDLLTEYENTLDKYFNSNTRMKLPTVEKLAYKLNVSSTY